MIILIDFDNLARSGSTAELIELRTIASMQHINIHIQLQGVKQLMFLKYNTSHVSWITGLVGSNRSRPFDTLSEAVDYILKTLYYMK